MNNEKQEPKLTEIYFTPATAANFNKNEKVDTMIINTALKLVQESIEAISILGEFTSIVFDDGLCQEVDEEYYHPSQFSDLEYDLFMFREMISSMQENISNPNSIVAIYPKDEEQHIVAFFTEEDDADESVLFEEMSTEDEKLMREFGEFLEVPTIGTK